MSQSHDRTGTHLAQNGHKYTQLHTHNTWSTYVRTTGVTYGRIRAVGGSRKAAVTAVHQVKHGCIKGTKCHVFTVKLRKCSYVKAFAFESLLSRRVQQILLNQLYDENMVIKRHRNRGYNLLNSTKCKYLFWDLLSSAAPNTSWVFGGEKVKTLYFHESPLILNHHVSIAFLPTQDRPWTTEERAICQKESGSFVSLILHTFHFC